jgi:hypothetical protein
VPPHISHSWAPFCDCIAIGALCFCFKRCYVVDLGAGWVGSELRRGRHHYLVYGMN